VYFARQLQAFDPATEVPPAELLPCRAKVLLMAADGVANSQIAANVGVTPVTVRAWRDRFASEGLAKLGQVRQGRGRKPGISAEKIEQIVRLTQHEKPAGAMHWSCRSVAKQAGSLRPRFSGSGPGGA
jgi:transposase